MFGLISGLSGRELVARETPQLVLSLAIAEAFYKFHSFTLECLAFLATWYGVGLLGMVAGRGRRARETS